MDRPEDVTITRVTVDDTHPVRQEVLRNHAPGLSPRSPTDDNHAAVHLAARVGDEIVGVVSVAPSDGPVDAPDAWRLSGMAVREPWRSRGVGSALIARLVEEVGARGGRTVWAHARDSALRFYERHGFTVIGDGFDQSLLPHHLVIRPLDRGGRSALIRRGAERLPGA